MNLAGQPAVLAKLSWQDPQSGEMKDFFLPEGGTAGIGRLEDNHISIREQHVSRQHAVIDYRDGVFVITDLGSANGVYVNDERITEPYPLIAGDIIRLYVPVLTFSAVTLDEERQATEHGTIAPVNMIGTGRLTITNGAQQGVSIPLGTKSMTVGRATSRADWEVALPDTSVSRPHARLDYVDETWVVYDLGSANGTRVNGTPITEKGRVLRDGDRITFGSTVVEFRSV